MKPSFRTFALLLCSLFTVSFSHGQSSNPNDEIRSVILLVRHGVRAPIESETRSGAYNAQPWPAWPSAPGVLTEHGATALKLLADYYRARYPTLLGNVSCSHPGIYAEANTTQRTIASAKVLVAELAPSCSLQVHTSPMGQRNPLFSPADSPAVDHQELTDATNGRMANQPDWFTNAFAIPLEKMHHVLMDCDGKDCDKTKPDFRTIRVQNGTASPRNNREENPVTLGADFAENFLLEYTQGLPMEQVGWGRVSRSDLNQLMEMNTRYHDFMLRTPYSTQVVASDLAARIRNTILASVSGRAIPGELGTPQDHVILLDAHDGNLSWLGGLLRLDWILSDQTFNATPPGGGFAFEVHHDKSTGANTVQVFFISQTLDQMRSLLPLAGSEQPSVAPIFVPGCNATALSVPGSGYACTVEDFDKVVTNAIDPRFVEPGVKLVEPAIKGSSANIPVSQ
jgi:4-phytase/acid phosphatase